MATYITVDQAIITEGSNEAVFKLHVSGTPLAADTTVNIMVGGGTDATLSMELFDALLNATLVLPANTAAGAVVTFTVALAGTVDGLSAGLLGVNLMFIPDADGVSMTNNVVPLLVADADRVSAGAPGFAASNVVVDEAAGQAVITWTLDAVATHDISIDYTTRDFSASAGSDYGHVADTLLIPAGQAAGMLTIALVADGNGESPELFSVEFANPQGATLTTDVVHVLVQDSNAPAVLEPVVNAYGATVSEDQGYVDFVVALQAPATGEVRVDYSTLDGSGLDSAMGYVDYGIAFGTLVFAPGEVSRTVRVLLIDNDTTDASLTRSFELMLSGISGATAGVTTAVATMVDNDSGLAGTSANPLAITATSGQGELLAGTAMMDRITGGAGNDVLSGAAGADTLNGLAGNDRLLGSAGNDTLTGGAGIDTLAGGAGSDTYTVDDAGDLVVETDPVATSGGADRVNSLLASYTLTDHVEQGRITAAGAANLSGNALSNTLYAGTGSNVLDGAGGVDTASWAFATKAVSVSLAITGAQATGGSGSDALVDIENLTGSRFNDSLGGNAGANTLDGGAGADTLSGGDGNDTYVVDNIGDLVVETNAAAAGGLDRVNSLLSACTLADQIEDGRITAAGAADLTGNALANTLYAGAGDNVLDGAGGIDTASYAYATAAVDVSLALAGAQDTGGSGSDTLVAIEKLTGSRYDDSLAGDAGANTLDGGAGADTLSGGDGNDSYVVDNTGDLVIETHAATAGGGSDLVSSRLAAYTLTDNVEAGRILLATAADLSGNALNNALYAGAGNNVIDGGAGTDTVSYGYATAGVQVSLAVATAQATGGSGSDTLVGIENLVGSGHADHLAGSSGANSINGGNGADTLSGGLGNDTLAGGAGNDVFVFDTALNASTNVDRIADYAAGDSIALDNDVYTALGAAGAFDAAQFHSGAGLTGASSATPGAGIYYNTSTGALYYDADGVGGLASIKFATLTGLPAAASLHFIVQE